MSGLTLTERNEIIRSLTPEEAHQLLNDWRFWARDDQLPPAHFWRIWLQLSGRGSGKTWSGANLAIEWAKQGYSPIALIGKTKADVRDTMVELGESSIIKISPDNFIPDYEPSKRRLLWPNGVIGIIYSGDEPDQLRGPQHAKAWVDELAKFQYAKDTWENLMFGLRVGLNPQVIATTTPRPIPIIKNLVEEAKQDPSVVITRGTILDNLANLPTDYVEYLIRRYKGTRIGRQELFGELLEDNPGALWTRATLDEGRVHEYPHLTRIVVGVDPEATATSESAETGIIVAGAQRVGVIDKGYDDYQGYILEDMSLRGTPEEWGRQVVTAYNKYKADAVVAETNNGGDMVEYVIKSIDRRVNVIKVSASRGKYARAEPVSALYTQKQVHHVGANFAELEDQLCEWVPGETSPDRLDALVWAIFDLMLKPAKRFRIT